ERSTLTSTRSRAPLRRSASGSRCASPPPEEADDALSRGSKGYACCRGRPGERHAAALPRASGAPAHLGREPALRRHSPAVRRGDNLRGSALNAKKPPRYLWFASVRTAQRVVDRLNRSCA